MSIENLLTIAGVTISNLLLPFLMTGADISGAIGSTLNIAVGLIGMIVLYLLRNNIRYHITFTNIEKPASSVPVTVEDTQAKRDKMNPEAVPEDTKTDEL